MGTAAQMVWSVTSGLLRVPREAENTTKPFSPAQTTGANITYAVPQAPKVSGEEQEWASLLASERKGLAKRRVKPRAVNKAIRGLRYSR
jgi:hypothetical protein